MQARFLLGPAGSGKTHRCLAEIRAALHAAPVGPPLLLLAPKQATFQLERQLLADRSLPGYTRLRILSPERLAGFVLDAVGASAPPLLSEEGRVMVLRALLTRQGDKLRVFHSTARLAGFAIHLSGVLRELQEARLTPERLEVLARRLATDDPLTDKLHDLALLWCAYREWLDGHALHDASQLFDLATEALKRRPVSAGAAVPLRPGGLWLDGFAEMTPQEMDLVGALVPHCAHATLAFCLENAAGAERRWLSPWAVVGRTFRGMQDRLHATPGSDVVTEELSRDPRRSRFAGHPVLGHLEHYWAAPTPLTVPGEVASQLRVVACANPEAEAVFAARAIRRYVREGRGRYRDIAVLARSLEDCHDVLRRVFTRYEIPFFLDRRQAVTHHPLAELTRHGLRIVAFGWQHDDWFSALKTGLADDDEAGLDRLENEALARGWKGEQWRQPLRGLEADTLGGELERLRARVSQPFEGLAADLRQADNRPTGPQLAAALRCFWGAVEVERKLQAWANPPAAAAGLCPPEPRHATVWEQMNALLDNLARAFSSEPLALVDWLPLLDAGLANLTVGVIPPALDQVLIGAVDRSRNPDLRFVLLPGLNEGFFPAVPPPAVLLTDTDRESLESLGVELGPDRRRQLGRERFYGYIACTRARERLVLTCSGRGADDRVLPPSIFVAHLQQLFPTLTVESAPDAGDLRPAEHWCELVPTLLRAAREPAPSGTETSPNQPEPTSPLSGTGLESIAQLAEWRRGLPAWRGAPSDEFLSPGLPEQLYGATLRTSVSRIEQFAACPFRFFVNSGLGAEERLCFEVDPRQRGSFQHDVLQRFHEEVRAAGREWRDLTPEEARGWIGRVADERAVDFAAGLFLADERSRFTARSLTRSLQEFIGVIVGWMRGGYAFDPRLVEVAFGFSGDGLPAWTLPLPDGHELGFRGRIDRLDVARDAAGRAWLVVLDYKSSARKIDPVLLAHGVQIQLPAYLAALRGIPGLAALLGANAVVPAGVFYVALRGSYPRGASRAEVLDEAGASQARAYQHRGRFRLDALPWLDPGGGGQFSYRLKQDGQPYANSTDPVPAPAFVALLDAVEEQLRRLGTAIYAGDARVDPYVKGTNIRACDTCEYQGICRIDPWTHAYRRLTLDPASAPR